MIWLYVIIGFLFVGCCCWRVKKPVRHSLGEGGKDVSTQTDRRVSFVVPAIIDNYVTATDATEQASAGQRRRRRMKKKQLKEKDYE